MKQNKSLIEFFYEYMKSGCLDVPATGWTERAQARRIAKINRFLSRLELWGRDSDEFKIILRLFIYDRKDIVELYLKLRRKILDVTALETIINRNMTVRNLLVRYRLIIWRNIVNHLSSLSIKLCSISTSGSELHRAF